VGARGRPRRRSTVEADLRPAGDAIAPQSDGTPPATMPPTSQPCATMSRSAMSPALDSAVGARSALDRLAMRARRALESRPSQFSGSRGHRSTPSHPARRSSPRLHRARRTTCVRHAREPAPSSASRGLVDLLGRSPLRTRRRHEARTPRRQPSNVESHAVAGGDLTGEREPPACRTARAQCSERIVARLRGPSRQGVDVEASTAAVGSAADGAVVHPEMNVHRAGLPVVPPAVFQVGSRRRRSRRASA